MDMAERTDGRAIPNIAALPPTTVRQLGSSQALVDPSSVVKELIENALDARASAIFVDISANTVDSIQVKDTGHGITQEDRPLACLRYCTSKVRDFQDLRKVGGKWLGFRGEALASMAEMSGLLVITTRVEGEAVAVKLKYGRNGELTSTERASAPVGTTVKITNFFAHLSVRKQTALKHSTRWLAKIRRLIQAYALARPAVRFSLHVVKAKSSKGDFMYAPKKGANVEDAVFKVVGKDCALQCECTALETEGFVIHAFLPKSTAVGAKVANEGAFVAVDGRPISVSRGTLKRIPATFKEYLRKANPALASVKDPFFSMNIICPPDSYDPNIEPAKDDVLFDNGDLVVAAVDKLLMAYYPGALSESVEMNEELETPTTAQVSTIKDYTEAPKRSKTPIYIHGDPDPNGDSPEFPSSPPKGQPRWRSNMYGIDEEDLSLVSEHQPPIIEEEEGRRAADVSNPWTIARMNAPMNAPMKQKRPFHNGQLMSPAKSQADIVIGTSSPGPIVIPGQRSSVEPLTPQTSSRQNVTQRSTDALLVRTIQPLPNPLDRLNSKQYGGQERAEVAVDPSHDRRCFDLPLPCQALVSPTSSAFKRSGRPALETGKVHNSFDDFYKKIASSGAAVNVIPFPSSTPDHMQRENQSRHTDQLQPNDQWFGQTMRGHAAVKQPCRRKQLQFQNQNALSFPSDVTPSPLCNSTEDTLPVEKPFYSKNNTDIRDFFGRARNEHKRRTSAEAIVQSSSVTPINAPSRQLRGRVSHAPKTGERNFPQSMPALPLQVFSRATSTEPLPCSTHVRNSIPLQPQRAPSIESADIVEQLRACAAQDTSSQPEPQARSKILYAPPGIDQFLVHEHHTSHKKDELVSHVQPCQTPLKSPAFQAPTKTRPARRVTTDRTQRTRSSKLPLERVPHGYRIQNIVLQNHLKMADVVKAMQKMDLSRNSLGWGHAASKGVYDAFNAPIFEENTKQWVRDLQVLLDADYERERDVDVALALESGIVTGLHGRISRTKHTDIEVRNDAITINEDAKLNLDAAVSPDSANDQRVAAWTEEVLAASPQLKAVIPPARDTSVADPNASKDVDEFAEFVDLGSVVDSIDSVDGKSARTEKKDVDVHVEEDEMLIDF